MSRPEAFLHLYVTGAYEPNLHQTCIVRPKRHSEPHMMLVNRSSSGGTREPELVNPLYPTLNQQRLPGVSCNAPISFISVQEN